MPELPRDLPHLYIRGGGRAEPHTSRLRGRGPPLPQRERTAHADAVRVSLAAALAAAEQLENRPKHIEPVAVHERTENEPSRATVFVPEAARDHYLRKCGCFITVDRRSAEGFSRGDRRE